MSDSSPPEPRRVPLAWRLAPLLPLLLAVALRFRGLGWGLPDLFEEATPFFRAWEMIGGHGTPPSPDPHFYRYPSLTFYVHAAAQGVLALGAWLQGGVEAVRDLPATFLADRAPHLVAARTVSALFGVAAVAGTWAAGCRLGGRAVALPGALILAVCAFHVERSQFIDVDGPLAAFVVWGLWACLRLAESGTARRHVVAGVFVGLAASAKYPGALLVVPLVVAHAIGGDGGPRRRSAAIGGDGGLKRRAARLGFAAVAAAIAFAVTSPYVVANPEETWHAVAAERQHMERGHFGQEEIASWRAYVQELPRVLGWPLALAAAGGAILGIVRRRPAVLVILSFVATLGAVMGSWRMHELRYLLPVVPALVLLAAWLAAELARGARRRAILLATTVVLAVPAAAGLPEVWARGRSDPRTLAREWIERNVAPHSFLVMEAWGPDLLEPVDLWSIPSEIRKRFLALDARPLYAVLNLPSFQVMPEMSEAFYEVALYSDADLFVLSSPTGDRYRREPSRFPVQVAFCEELDRRMERVAEFGGEGERRPRITVYRPRAERTPFGARESVAGVRELTPGRRRPPPGEAAFWRDVGLNYETFGFLEAAIRAYGRGLAIGEWAEGSALSLALGSARSLRAVGRGDEAIPLVEDAARRCPYTAEAAELRAMAADLRRMPPRR